jgi:signal transduction histidine kinase
MDSSKNEEGIGLKNIYNRIRFLKGEVDFDSAPGKGTAIVIHVPLPNTTS